MTHIYAGMNGKTVGGFEFEVFAERDGKWYGMVEGRAISWRQNGQCSANPEWHSPSDIPLPEPVRKWRWVIKRNPPYGYHDEYGVTGGHYQDAVSVEEQWSGWKAIQRIDESEVRE